MASSNVHITLHCNAKPAIKQIKKLRRKIWRVKTKSKIVLLIRKIFRLPPSKRGGVMEKWFTQQKDITCTEVQDKAIVLLSGETLRQLMQLISSGNVHDFYVSPEWRHLRAEVLREQKNECQEHRKRGIYARANHVHHVNYLRNHPELALSKWYLDKQGMPQRNLIAVCHTCHETVCHPERLRHSKPEPWPEDWS